MTYKITLLTLLTILALAMAGFSACDDGGTPLDNGGDADSDSDSDSDCDASGEGYWEPDWAALECEVLDLTNQARAEGADCGVEGTFGPADPLTMQHQLREAARFHSQDMGDRAFFTHESPGGPNGDTVQDRIENAGYTNWQTWGENIAAGQTTAQEVVDGWLASDGHCSNIMNPMFEEIGVGYAHVPGAPYQGIYWTQDFGAQF